MNDQMNTQFSSVVLKTRHRQVAGLKRCDLTFYRNKISRILHPSSHSIFRTRNKEKQIVAISVTELRLP